MKNRAGSYKKILIDFETLKVHGDYLRTNIETLQSMSLSPTDFTTFYLLLFLRIKHPKNWLQKKNKDKNTNKMTELFYQEQIPLLSLIPKSFKLNNWEIQKLERLNALDLFSDYNLKAIPESINRTMVNWYQGIWKIECLQYIPGPRELLRLQVKDTRCLTLITDPLKIDSYVLGTRDPLSFLIHDLMHADQFFNQHESRIGQLGFYFLINAIYDKAELKAQLFSDMQFKKEFEYVSSDMNAYVIHLFKCLKSAINRVDNTDHLFELILSWWDMNEGQKDASRRLNTPQFHSEDEQMLKIFFESHQELNL
jgi:hypothetical protein